MGINRAGETLVSALVANSHNQDILSNNLANVSTTGFHRDGVSFKSVLDGQAISNEVQNSRLNRSLPLDESVYYGHLMVDMPVKLDGYYTHRNEGELVFTDNNLDVALVGDGYFAVNVNGEEKYTRAGKFVLNSSNQIVTEDGHPLVGLNGNPIQAVGNDINIMPSGEVQVDGEIVGRFRVVKSNDLTQFQKEGNSFYRFSGKEEDLYATEDMEVLSGYLEGANVNPITELGTMTLNMRSFEASVSAMRDISRTLERAINTVGKA